MKLRVMRSCGPPESTSLVATVENWILAFTMYIGLELLRPLLLYIPFSQLNHSSSYLVLPFSLPKLHDLALAQDPKLLLLLSIDAIQASPHCSLRDYIAILSPGVL